MGVGSFAPFLAAARGEVGLPVSLVIAIDGPVASGKSTVGKALAKRLGYRFVDTGLMYRAITWAALVQGVSPEDEEALGALTRRTEIDLASDAPWDDTPRGVLVDGTDVTANLFSPEVEGVVSLVSRVAEVRTALVAPQRRMAEGGGLVMAGRDIGTQVLPDARAKVFLEASIEERTRRRHLEQLAAGQATSAAEIRRGLEQRDTLDSQRAHSPLRAADDAWLIQTDGLSMEEVVQQVLSWLGEG